MYKTSGNTKEIVLTKKIPFSTAKTTTQQLSKLKDSCNDNQMSLAITTLAVLVGGCCSTKIILSLFLPA